MDNDVMFAAAEAATTTVRVLLKRQLVTLRAKLSGAVYCNRSCLQWVCLCVFV